MTEREMLEAIKDARLASESMGTVWALSNGKEIRSAYTYDRVRSYKENGFWVCAIFENGHRVEA